MWADKRINNAPNINDGHSKSTIKILWNNTNIIQSSSALKYTIVGYGIRTFLEEENSDFGGGKWEIDAPQPNKCEFNHGGHINSTFADLERKNTKKNVYH